MGDQVFEVYIRNQDGDTRHLPLREGLKEFLDEENGYRLTLNIEGVVFTLRKGHQPDDEWKALDNFIGDSTTVACAVTIRGSGLRASNSG